MKRIFYGFLLLFFLIFAVLPTFVQSEVEQRIYHVTENIKEIADFLKEQDYYENISQICHENECFSIDIHDIKRSINNIENKMLKKIEENYGEEVAIQTKLKGFSITNILTR